MVKAARDSGLLLWAGLFGPPIFVAVCILIFGVNVYVQDEWDAIAAMLVGASQKGWSVSLLWEPHNEHRLLLPRALFALLHGHGPHLVAGMLLSLAVMGLCFALLYRVLLRPALRETSLPPALIGALFSALFFSFGQKENLLWNFQLAWSIAICGFVLAALGLQAGRMSWFLCGLSLCYTSSAHWVALVPLVILDGGNRLWQTQRSRTRISNLWQAAARIGLLLLLFKLYVRDGATSPLGPFLRYAAQQPLSVAEYFLMLLGNVHAWPGVSPTAPLSLVGGALFLALASMLFLRGELRPDGRSGPAFYLIAGMLILAAIITMGRAPLGIAQALDSRYQACTLFGWFALLCTVLRTTGQTFSARWARWLLLGCLVNIGIGSVNGLRIAALFDAPVRQRGLACQEALLRNGQPLTRPECAGLLHPAPARQEQLTRELHARDLL